MKRLLALLLCSCMIAGFSSCNAASAEKENPGSTSSTDSSESENASPTEEPKETSEAEEPSEQNLYVPDSTFEISTDEFVELLGRVAEEQDRPNTQDLFTEKDDMNTEDEPFSMRTYTLDDGVYMFLSETKDTNTLFSIMLSGEQKTMTPESLETFKFYITCMFNAMDYDNMSELAAQMNEQFEDTEGTSFQATGEFTEYVYKIINSQCMFFANPI